jgi:hypothetical protein
MFAVLDLGDGRKFACETLDYAKEAWRESFADMTEATIDVYPSFGNAGLVSTYRFDDEIDDWVRSR